MARIRNIKSEFWEDSKIGSVSIPARLTFIGLWNFMDKAGVVPLNLKVIRAKIFPMDDLNIEQVKAYIDELIAARLIFTFDFKGEYYVYCPNFSKHQSFSKSERDKPPRYGFNEECCTSMVQEQYKYHTSTADIRHKTQDIGHKKSDSAAFDEVQPSQNLPVEISKPAALKPTASTPFPVVTVEKESENPIQAAIAHYCDLFKAKYGTHPPIRGKDSGIFKNLIRELGMPRMLKLLDGYFQMNDQWFLTKRHSIGVFCDNLNSVTIFCDTGQALTKKQTQAVESLSATKAALDAVFGEDEQ